MDATYGDDVDDASESTFDGVCENCGGLEDSDSDAEGDACCCDDEDEDDE